MNRVYSAGNYQEHVMRYTVAILSFALFAPTGRADEKTFDSNGTKIAYLDEGKGEAVVLLHGFSASAEEM